MVDRLRQPIVYRWSLDNINLISWATFALLFSVIHPVENEKSRDFTIAWSR